MAAQIRRHFGMEKLDKWLAAGGKGQAALEAYLSLSQVYIVVQRRVGVPDLKNTCFDGHVVQRGYVVQWGWV